MRKYYAITFTLFIFMNCEFSLTNLSAQSLTYYQYWNHVNFAHPFKGKWAGEIGLSSTFTSSADQRNPFFYFSQYNVNGAIHHYFNSRWKLSMFTSLYLNTEVMDFQRKSHEWRFSPQGIYYFHKRDYTLSTIARFEARYIKSGENGFTDYYRYRQQLRYLKPFNSKIILEGVWYGIAAEELVFKLNSTPDQSITFDRNRLILGVGYSVTNNMQIEITYVNEYLPRTVNEKYNAISVTFNFNNFINNFKENLHAILPENKPDEE